MPALQYSTGTVSVGAGGTTVTGVGAIWSDINARQFDLISIDGLDPVLITSKTDTTHLEIPEWQGGAKTGVTYVVYQLSPYRFVGGQAMADVSRLIAALNTNGWYVFVPSTDDAPDDSYGDDGQYARQPSTGKEWYKEGGAWTYLGLFGALSFDPVAWSSGTTYSSNVIVPRGGKLWISRAAANEGNVPESSPLWWTQYLAGGDRYDIITFDTDRPATGELLLKMFPVGVTFPAGLTDSYGGAEVDSAATAVFSFRKNGTEFATLTFSAGNVVGVFACASDTTFALGDELKIIAPNPRDTDLSGVAAHVVAYRN